MFLYFPIKLGKVRYSYRFSKLCCENYLEPDEGNFLEEIRKRFNIPDESIKIVEHARDNVIL